MRGEFSLSHGGLKRARNRKRWIRPKKAYSSPGLLYSEPGLCAPFLTVIPVAAIVPPLCTAETGPGSQVWLADTFAPLSGESSVAIGNVGVAAQDVLEPIFLSLHVVAIGRARDVGLQPYGQRQPVPRQPAKAVAFVGTRSGLLNVDSLLYRSVGSGARAHGQRAPLARLVWIRACDGNAMAIIGADRSWWRFLSSRQLKTLRLRYSPQHRARRGTEVLFSARDVAAIELA